MTEHHWNDRVDLARHDRRIISNKGKANFCCHTQFAWQSRKTIRVLHRIKRIYCYNLIGIHVVRCAAGAFIAINDELIVVLAINQFTQYA